VIIPDVNVWIDALRTDAPSHERIRAWLDEAIASPEPVGVSELVFSGVLRIMTHPRLLPHPLQPGPLLDELNRIRGARGVVPVRPGLRHWRIFTELCRAVTATGNQVPDAFHAALAIEADAVFVSADRALARFPGLKYRHPLEGESA
jgi:toxin-antitoxin system PIN domain toxin